MQDEMLMHVRELPDYINIEKILEYALRSSPPLPSPRLPPFPVINALRFIPLAWYTSAYHTSGGSI